MAKTPVVTSTSCYCKNISLFVNTYASASMKLDLLTYYEIKIKFHIYKYLLQNMFAVITGVTVVSTSIHDVIMT